MKANQRKMPVYLLLFISAVFGLTNCGQQKETVTAADKTDSSTKIITADTAVNNAPAIDHTATTAADINSNKIKETQADVKTTAEQKQVTEKKTAPVIIATPAPEKPAPVVVVTEPAKPVPENKPAPKPVPVEVPKPAPVATTATVQGNWPVPEKYRSMTSPYPVNKESLELGKSVYGTHCKSCHGSKGDGQGSKASTLDTEIRSFASSGFRSQLPGEVYYKSIIGRKDMPKFDKKIPDEEERWAVVNYIRTF